MLERYAGKMSGNHSGSTRNFSKKYINFKIALQTDYGL